MRQLIVIEFVTLDGVMQGLGSPDEDRDGGFAYGGWGAPYGDDILQEAARQGMESTTAYLFGRRTYEKMLAFWPQQPNTNPMAAHLNTTPKYIATRTLDDAQLVNGYRLFLHPLLLGGGKRLFNHLDQPQPLQLVSVEQTSTGVVMLSYDCM
jgi:dihydrofolate reductase